MKSTYLDVVRTLEKYRNKKKALIYANFFKTKKGEYGEGDQFFGISVPEQRKIAKKFLNLSLSEIDKLLRQPVHECRLTALIIAVAQYQKPFGSAQDKEKIYNWYIKNAKRVNNWDLVDLSASYIVGHFLYESKKKNDWKKVLSKLLSSKNLWERRIAIVSTWFFIRQSNFLPTLFVSEKLLKDKHDLIHKAVGWMLREVGKKDEKTLYDFLNVHMSYMPRTTLRYAIEKMSKKDRFHYLGK